MTHWQKPWSNSVSAGHRNVMYTNVTNSHTETWHLLFYLYIQQHLRYIHQTFTPLSLVYCDMRYMRGKFLLTPQLLKHGNLLLKILQHCIHSATFNDCLKTTGHRGVRGVHWLIQQSDISSSTHSQLQLWKTAQLLLSLQKRMYSINTFKNQQEVTFNIY